MSSLPNHGPKPFECCLCFKTIAGQWGNNPAPLAACEDGSDCECEEPYRCCDDCNSTIVVPARLMIARAPDMEASIVSTFQLAALMKTSLALARSAGPATAKKPKKK